MILNANALHIPLADESIDCCVTSPPYWGLRSYLDDDDPNKVYELGAEPTPEAYVANMVQVFREVWRVLKPEGTLWLNLGDSYNGSGGAGGDYSEGGLKEGQPKYPGRKVSGLKPKDLVGIPWRVAFALQADGWYLRSEIIWHKPNPMPESVRDRPTKAHEQIFLLAKQQRYYYDAEAVMEKAAYDGRKDEQFKGAVKSYDGVLPDGKPQSFAQNGHPRWTKDENGLRVRNKRSVWSVSTKSYTGAHFATFPPRLIEPCILAGCPAGGIVLDPFFGSGTTGQVAVKHGRQYVGLELNMDYIQLATKRTSNVEVMLPLEAL